MATRKTPTLDPNVEVENKLDKELDEDIAALDKMLDDYDDYEDLEEMTDISEAFESSITIGIPKERPKYKGPRVTVNLPLLDDPGDGGIKVDQYEHVTIANERGETCYKVRRGEPVEVPVPVFMILKARYPKC